MYENPGDDLYFGEVYRQVLQESWLPENAQDWARVGKSTRGRRPTTAGILPNRISPEQSNVRLGFSNCAAAWRSLPWDTPNLPYCDDRWGKDYWLADKQDRGLQCSYYDDFMRYCLKYWLANQCIMPSAYTLTCAPDLTNVICNAQYSISISGGCGPISLVSGPGVFTPPDLWTAPACGDDGLLSFKDANGASGCINYAFDPAHHCDSLIWPDTNPEDIAQDSSQTITIQGGVPPYHWLVAGTGFSLANSHTEGRSNTLIAGPAACGTAATLVTDHCDAQVTGYVRCTAGQWLGCGQCGPRTCPSGSHLWTTLITGDTKRYYLCCSVYADIEDCCCNDAGWLNPPCPGNYCSPGCPGDYPNFRGMLCYKWSC